jgi:hypothetical protein
MPGLSKVFGWLIVLWLITPAKTQAQQDDTTGFVAFKATKFPVKANTVKIGVIPFLVGEIPWCGEIRITYEHPITHNQSLLAGLSYNYPGALLLLESVSTPGSGISDFSWRGGRIMLGYRWYPLKRSDAPKGFYFGPYFSYNFLKIRDKQDHTIYETMDYLNASLLVGEQVLAHNGFTFDVFGGFGYKDNFIAHSDPNLLVPIIRPTDLLGISHASNAAQHFKFTLQVNFGYSF